MDVAVFSSGWFLPEMGPSLTTLAVCYFLFLFEQAGELMFELRKLVFHRIVNGVYQTHRI